MGKLLIDDILRFGYLIPGRQKISTVSEARIKKLRYQKTQPCFKNRCFKNFMKTSIIGFVFKKSNNFSDSHLRYKFHSRSKNLRWSRITALKLSTVLKQSFNVYLAVKQKSRHYPRFRKMSSVVLTYIILENRSFLFLENADNHENIDYKRFSIYDREHFHYLRRFLLPAFVNL